MLGISSPVQMSLVGIKNTYASSGPHYQYGIHLKMFDVQNLPKFRGFPRTPFENSFNRSLANSKPLLTAPTKLTMAIAGGSNVLSTVDGSTQSNGTPGSQTGSIPVLSLNEVAGRLHEYTHPKCKPYTAMYSSVVGGITLDPAAMVIPLDDHMVHRGHGVFDTATIYNGHLYELDAHIDRIFRSAAQARITPPFSKSALRNILVQTVAASGTQEGTLRYWLSTGPGGFSLSSAECEGPALYAVMIAGSVNRSIEAVKVVTSTVPIKRPQFATMKTTNYLPNALAKLEAEDKGAFQAIWLDDEGFIAEAANMNVAFVSKGTLLVPSFDKILSGCTAKRLLILAEKLIGTRGDHNKGLLQSVKVGKISVEEAKAADEMMLIVSGYLIVHVTEWDGQPVGNGKPGPVSIQLYSLLHEDMTHGPPEVREPVPYRQ